MTRPVDPEGNRLPIKVDATSNGEFQPIPLGAVARTANRLARERARENARRRGVSRRAFMVSACGAASTLLAFNAVNAAAGRTGGRYELDEVAAVDADAAIEQLAGREFIFDVQGHFVGRNGLGNVGLGDVDAFIKDVFVDSDTDMMVLSFIPSRRDNEYLSIDEADAARRLVERLQGSHRLLLHGRVNPNQDGDLEHMDELAETWRVAGWKTYTQWGPDRPGFFMHDEETGIRLIENARRLGIRTICIHKGIPFGRRSYEHSLCDDIGIVAKRYPDVNFLIYHSGFIPGEPEGPYDAERGEGVDSLIRSVVENGVPPNSNVFAELGSTWRFVMRNPDWAAHTLGKLLKYIGEDNVLWGTDSIWYGSPQDQIQAFRVFQIAEELREAHGYREITPALRAKVFGLNAARPYGIDVHEVLERAGADAVSRQKAAYGDNPDPHFLTFGPRTRKAYRELMRRHGGSPV